MLSRILTACLLVGLVGNACANEPNQKYFTLGVSTSGVTWVIHDEMGDRSEVIPYPWLPGADAAVFCVRLVHLYGIIEKKVEDAEAEESRKDNARPGADGGSSFHLLGVAKRCELNGDLDMAVNCYTEVLRLQAGTRLAEQARQHLQRLSQQSPANDADDLRRLLPLTIPLGLYHNGSVLFVKCRFASPV